MNKKLTKSEETKAVPERPRRIPVSGPRDILTVQDKDPNYVYRMVNDIDDRIERFKLGGYEIVTSEHEIGMPSVDRASRTGKFGSAITKNVGGGVTAVLMRIPKEFWDEDQAAKAAEVDKAEAAMRELGKKQGEYGDVKIFR